MTNRFKHPVGNPVTVVTVISPASFYGFPFQTECKERKSHKYHFPRTACSFRGGNRRGKHHPNLTPVQLGNRFRRIRARAA